jgi:hypothetical protein
VNAFRVLGISRRYFWLTFLAYDVLYFAHDQGKVLPPRQSDKHDNKEHKEWRYDDVDERVFQREVASKIRFQWNLNGNRDGYFCI